MIIEAKKSVSKILLALLIVVISWASTQVSADALRDHQLAKICRQEVDSDFKPGYEREHRKCFVVGTKEMNWTEAKLWCSQLPRIPNFGPPALASTDLKAAQMEKFLTGIMKLSSLYLWTGGYLPMHYRHPKNNHEWRWVADYSRLSASDPAWCKTDITTDGFLDPQPEEAATQYCAAMWPRGLYDIACEANNKPLCHYEAEKPKICTDLPLPKNTYLTSTVVTVSVHCTGARVVKGTHKQTEQHLIYQHGEWISEAKECV